MVFEDVEKMTLEERANYATDFLVAYGQIDGEHHKNWVVDQTLRILIGNKKDYEKTIEEYCCGECEHYAPQSATERNGDSCSLEECDGSYYEWCTGIAP